MGNRANKNKIWRLVENALRNTSHRTKQSIIDKGHTEYKAKNKKLSTKTVYKNTMFV